VLTGMLRIVMTSEGALLAVHAVASPVAEAEDRPRKSHNDFFVTRRLGAAAPNSAVSQTPSCDVRGMPKSLAARPPRLRRQER